MNMVLQYNTGDEFLQEAEYAKAVTSHARLAADGEIQTIQVVINTFAEEIPGEP